MNLFIYIYLLIAILMQVPSKRADFDVYKFISLRFLLVVTSEICGTQGIVIFNFTFIGASAWLSMLSIQPLVSWSVVTSNPPSCSMQAWILVKILPLSPLLCPSSLAYTLCLFQKNVFLHLHISSPKSPFWWLDLCREEKVKTICQYY